MAEMTATTVARFWSKVEVGRPSTCWSWRGATADAGYGRFKIGDKLLLPHRVAYEIFHGEIEEGDGYHGTVVMHMCDNPTCCNPAHLRLGSHSDNMKDMCEKRRQIPSRVKAGTMLTADVVEAIADDPRPHRTIAAEYGVAKSTVWRIKGGVVPSAAERREPFPALSETGGSDDRV